MVKPSSITMIVTGLVIVWFSLVRAVWRANLLERFLGLKGDE